MAAATRPEPVRSSASPTGRPWRRRRTRSASCRECGADSVPGTPAATTGRATNVECRRRSTTMTRLRMDNVLIVVDDLEAAIAFFAELGLELEGQTTVEGPAVDRLVGLDGVR